LNSDIFYQVFIPEMFIEPHTRVDRQMYTFQSGRPERPELHAGTPRDDSWEAQPACINGPGGIKDVLAESRIDTPMLSQGFPSGKYCEPTITRSG
jgi:hypothetical protein